MYPWILGFDEQRRRLFLAYKFFAACPYGIHTLSQCLPSQTLPSPLSLPPCLAFGEVPDLTLATMGTRLRVFRSP